MSARTFLVTGGAGFIGSHLVERLIARGDRAVVLDDLSSGRRSNLAAVADHPRLEMHVGDARDERIAERLAARADHVLHLACVVGVRRVLDDPAGAADSCVRATDAMLRAAARRGVPFLLASSSEVYGRGVRVPFREDDDVVLGPTSRPRWAYAVAKATAEHLVLARHRAGDVAGRVVRFFNTSGPRQRPDSGMVLPSLVEQALEGGPVTVHGDGRQTRTFCHVDDAVEAVLRLVDAPAAAGRVVNVGGTDEVEILALAERVVAVVAAAGGPSAPVALVPCERAYGPGFDEPGRRVPDLSRLRMLTGFAPGRRLDDLVADAVAWARAARAAAA